jgi:hypothetical protein
VVESKRKGFVRVAKGYTYLGAYLYFQAFLIVHFFVYDKDEKMYIELEETNEANNNFKQSQFKI